MRINNIVKRTRHLAKVLLLAVMGVLLLVGCNTFDFARQQPTDSDIPLLYYPRLKPLTLSESQRHQIVREAYRVEPKRAIWFILVCENRSLEGKLYWNVEVFFAPDLQSRRIRSGTYVHLYFKEDSEPYLLPPQIYVQVSLAGTVFHKKLTLPDLTLLPFLKPTDLSDEELIEIVDFVRSGPALNDPHWHPNQVDPKLPIMAIEKQGETVRVTTGMQEAPLAGRGQMFTCRKVKGDWVIVDILDWVS